MQRGFLAIALSALLIIVFVAGCSSMKTALAEPKWSENYALDGDCDVPQMNDGSMYSTGDTHPPEYVKGSQADDSRFSEVNITLKEPKDIKKIVLRRRSEDSVPVDVDVMAMVNGEWQTVKEVRGEIKDDIDIRVSAVTNQIKIKAQRATRTAKGKSTASKSGRTSGGARSRNSEYERVLREPIKIAEVELYGIAAEGQS